MFLTFHGAKNVVQESREVLLFFLAGVVYCFIEEL